MKEEYMGVEGHYQGGVSKFALMDSWSG